MKKLVGFGLALCVLLATSSCSKTDLESELAYSEATVGNEKVVIDPVAMENELLDLVNKHRLSINLNALSKSETSYKYAEGHNDYMIAHNKLSHDNFESRAAKIAEETNAVLISENVARYYATAEVTMKSWLESATHKKAVEGDFTHTTLSVQLDKDGRPYYTQIFIKIE